MLSGALSIFRNGIGQGFPSVIYQLYLSNFLLSPLFQSSVYGNSLIVQWLGPHAVTPEGLGSIPGWGINIPQATRQGQKKNYLAFVNFNVQMFTP